MTDELKLYGWIDQDGHGDNLIHRLVKNDEDETLQTVCLYTEAAKDEPQPGRDYEYCPVCYADILTEQARQDAGIPPLPETVKVVKKKGSKASTKKPVKPIPTPPTPEEYFERGRIAREKKDDAQWELGKVLDDFTNEFNPKHEARPEKVLKGQWAKEVGIGKSTADLYLQMHRFYTEPDRGEMILRMPNVFYSHFRQAMVLHTTALAYEWLALVSERGMSVDEAAEELEKWMKAKGLKDGDDDGGDDEPGVCKIADDFSVTLRKIEKKNDEWVITLVAQEMDEIVEQLITDSREAKNKFLNMTLTYEE